MTDQQIDLEGVIAERAPTVSQFAARRGVPAWRVYRSIRKGALRVEAGDGPMRVVGGEIMMTVDEWHRALAPELERIKPSQFQFSDGGRQLAILTADGTVVVFKLPLTKMGADAHEGSIRGLAVRRLEVGA